MKTREIVVILGGGRDSIGIIERVLEAGYSPLIIDQDPQCSAWSLPIHIIDASCYEPDAAMLAVMAGCLREFRRSGRRPSICAVLGGGTDAVEALADIGAIFGLVAPSQETARICSDKFEMKMALLKAGVRVPEFWKAREPGMDGPREKAVVFKPIHGRGARGVVRVRPGEQDWPALKIALAAADSTGVMGETWIDGVQLSSESIIQDGQILWTAFAERNYSRLDDFHPHVIEDGSDMPPAIPAFHELDYEQLANEQLQLAINAIGLENGTLKADLVWDGERILVIEIAPRLSGGGFCSDLIPACWNVDFVGLALRVALGERILPGEIRPWLKDQVCQRFAFPGAPIDHPSRGGSVIGIGQTRDIARKMAEGQLHA